MTTQRVKCTNCDHMILPETAKANDGLCRPCALGDSYIWFKDLQKESDDLKGAVSDHSPVLEIEVPKKPPYSKDDFCIDSKSVPNFMRANFVGVFRGELSQTLFYPVGIRSSDGSIVEIEYIADPESVIDYEWISNSPLSSPAELVKIVSEAFEQYMGDKWCGSDVKAEVIEELEDETFYPKGESKCFVENGYYPYFEIVSVVIDRASDRIIINGRVDIDYNLEEHGVSILIDDGQVTFGYGADHV